MHSRPLLLMPCVLLGVVALPLIGTELDPILAFGCRLWPSMAGLSSWTGRDVDLGSALIIGSTFAAGLLCLLPWRWITRAPWLPSALLLLAVATPVGALLWVRHGL